MSENNFPLFPNLPEDGAKEAQALIDEFKKRLTAAAEEVIGTLYCDVMPHIESDSWTNFRNHLMDGLRNYGNRKIQGEYDFKGIRQAILREFRDEIIADLNQDMIAEIADLKKKLEDAMTWRGRGYE